MTYYTYTHRAGYGREDHLAGELIARAIRQLGVDTTPEIAAHLGLLPHSCPLGALDIRVPVARGVAARMRGALRRARREFAHRRYGPDCSVIVERVDG